MATTVTLKPNAIDISGSTSGTTTLQATAVAGTTTLTLPAATDTLVGKATTDTLTNKTLTTPSVSSPTISDGTANGVAYLNTSKVLTTGSALVFDGTNVGVGATPMAWKSDYKALQTGNATAVVGRTNNNNNYFASNWYVNTSNQDIYINDGFATLYSQGAGTHAWYTAASGTTGNPINFTQSLGINATGAVSLQGASTSANGVGITFPATQSASTDANTLDDYEEGTWTPVIIGTSATGTASYATRSAKYTKIGRLVTINTYVNWNSGTGTGNLAMTGLPFAEGGGSVYSAVVLSEFDAVSMTAGTYPTAYVVSGGTQITFEQAPTGGGTTITVPYDGTGQVIITATYQAAT